jgi:hypothetical protein
MWPTLRTISQCLGIFKDYMKINFVGLILVLVCCVISTMFWKLVLGTVPPPINVISGFIIGLTVQNTVGVIE